MSLTATFIDAAGLITLLDRNEPDHDLNGNLLRIQLNGGVALVTSNYEVVKAALELQRRHGIDGPRQLLRGFVPFLHVEWCSRRDHATAVAAHLAGNGDAGDLVDVTSAEIMRRTGAQPM
jgi:predicted nucleic acid-binding protein